MTWLDLIILALAANAITTAWFYGSIFQGKREALEKRGGLLGELVGCVLCLSYHISLWVVLLLWLPGYFTTEFACLFEMNESIASVVTTLLRVPSYGFAITTLVHYMQGILPLKETDDSTGISEDS